MNQLPLLSYSPVARRSDPASSHQAAAEITRDGSRARQQRVVLETVLRNPDHTAFELTRFCELDRYQIQRRLSEMASTGLVEKGPARVCSITGRQAVVWRVR